MPSPRLLVTLLALSQSLLISQTGAHAEAAPESVQVVPIDPPDRGFYAKRIDYQGISIKAHTDVADAALIAARNRLEMVLGKLPDVVANLAAEGVELHIIGKDQVTSDLPEHRHLKGKPFDGKLTVDQRTRGLGGRLVSCGEENLLRLPDDRYAGRDICVHEFAHAILAYGLSAEVRKTVKAQYRRSKDRGLWASYAGTNDDEFFAELTMWHFGTHGDYGKINPRPKPGRAWLKDYNPEAAAFWDDLFGGRIAVVRLQFVTLAPLSTDQEGTIKSTSEETPTTVRMINHTSREVLVFWLDFEGKRKERGKIPPGGQSSRKTFASHAWLLTDAEGKGLAIFIAEPKAGIGVLEESTPRSQ